MNSEQSNGNSFWSTEAQNHRINCNIPQSDLVFSLFVLTEGDLPVRVGKQVEGHELVSMT